MKNFYLKAQIDGRLHDIKSSPRGKNGGMAVRFYANDRGVSKELVSIDAYTALDKLCINVYLSGSKEPEIFILNRKEEKSEENSKV